MLECYDQHTVSPLCQRGQCCCAEARWQVLLCGYGNILDRKHVIVESFEWWACKFTWPHECKESKAECCPQHCFVESGSRGRPWLMNGTWVIGRRCLRVEAGGDLRTPRSMYPRQGKEASEGSGRQWIIWRCLIAAKYDLIVVYVRWDENKNDTYQHKWTHWQVVGLDGTACKMTDTSSSLTHK